MNESIQQVLTRLRPPRVKITYDVETQGSIQKKTLPFVVGVISDLSGDTTMSQTYKSRKFIFLDKDNLSNVMQYINPTITISIHTEKNEVTTYVEEKTIKNASQEDIAQSKNDNKKNIHDKNKTSEQVQTKRVQTNSESITITFTCIDDFHPDSLVHKIPYFQTLLSQRQALVDLSIKVDAHDVINNFLVELKHDKNKLQTLKTAAMQNPQSDVIKKLLTEMELPVSDENLLCISSYLQHMTVTNSQDAYVDVITALKNVDEIMSSSMDQILHNDKFKILEGRWRGLHYLINKSELGESLKIRLLVASRQEILQDLQKASEFDQSYLFKMVHDAEYGTAGGEPYSILIYDEYFSPSNQDVEFLRLLGQVAAASHAMLISSINADMFNMQSFTEINNPRDLSKIFDSSKFVKWKQLRMTEDARYISLTMPRTLMRPLYSNTNNPIVQFDYNETISSDNNDLLCWGNSAYTLGERINNAFSLYNWTSAIRGVEGGGLVTNLPTFSFKTIFGDLGLKCPSEVDIPDRREKELSDLGFISLCHIKDTDTSVFFSGQTIQSPKVYIDNDATENASLSARLPYILNASRFAHYIKMLMRDKIGKFMSGAEIQTYLQNWLAQYVLLSHNADQASKAAYPLREAKVVVNEEEGVAGGYQAILYLRPHFQFEEVAASIRLVAKLPQIPQQ